MTIREETPVNTEDEVAALKAATREAHEAIKDLRAVIKEAREISSTLTVEMNDAWEHHVQDTVREGLAGYNAEIKKQIDLATQAVFDRFMDLGDRLLGVDKTTRRRGEPSIEDTVRRLGM